ncbi:MAG TPA: sugar ABC transporter substrate-binding protein [Anaerolineae bacterium]|nr:sugar ABC transporter substrate-binding protein [Anaerolineae bacterium]
MKPIKSNFFFIVFHFNLCLLMACQSTSPTPTPTATIVTPTATTSTLNIDLTSEITASQPWRIAFLGKGNINPDTNIPTDLYQANAWLGAEQAATDFGIDLQLLPNPCQTCVEDQIRTVATLIDQGDLDGIIIMPTDSIRLAAVVEKAIAQGIPVIAMDTPLSSEQLTTFVAFDNYLAGQTLGRWVSEQLSAQDNVAILAGPVDHQNAQERRNGYITGLKNNQINVVATESANWDTMEAKAVVKSWLAEYNNLDAIMAANDGMALGAIEALQEANRTDILVTGFDAVAPAIEAIAIGTMAATIDQAPALQARLSLQLMVRHLENNEPLPPTVVLPDIVIVTKDNLSTYQP